MANLNKRAFYVNGELLKKILELRGLTQADVYKTVNIGENTIYRVIKFNRMENYDDFIKMCRYIDIDPRVLILKPFVYKSAELNMNILISPNNIESFIDHLGFINDYDKRFNKEYIHEFFQGAFGSDNLTPEFETFLFDKIIESRNIFTEMFWYNHQENINRDDNYNPDNSLIDDDFFELFSSWFDKNIKDKADEFKRIKRKTRK